MHEFVFIWENLFFRRHFRKRIKLFIKLLFIHWNPFLWALFRLLEQIFVVLGRWSLIAWIFFKSQEIILKSVFIPCHYVYFLHKFFPCLNLLRKWRFCSSRCLYLWLYFTIIWLHIELTYFEMPFIFFREIRLKKQTSPPYNSFISLLNCSILSSRLQ